MTRPMLTDFRYCIRLALVAIAAVMLTACAGTRPGPSASPAALPPDFSIDLTVLSDDPDMAMRPVHQRTSRYVVFPNGSLHVSFDAALHPVTLPPFVRTIRRAELDALWDHVQRITNAVAEAAEPAGNLRSIDASSGGVTASAVIQVNGRRSWLQARHSPADSADTPLAELTRLLAQLAWASDEPDLNQLRIPMRYDFGPDPYARYRTAPE